MATAFLVVVLTFGSQTGLFSLFFETPLQPILTVSPSTVYSTSFNQTTYSFQFTFSNLNHQYSIITIPVPLDYYLFDSSAYIDNSACVWVKDPHSIQCILGSGETLPDTFIVEFDIDTDPSISNIMRAELWSANFTPGGQSVSTTVRVDPPELSLSDMSGATFSDFVDIYAKETGNGIPHKVIFYVDGQEIGFVTARGTAHPTEFWGLFWDSTSVTDGSHMLKVKPCDSQVCTDTIQPVSITVDNDENIIHIECSITDADSPINVGEYSTIYLSYDGFDPEYADVICGGEAYYNHDLYCASNSCTLSCSPYALEGEPEIFVSLNSDMGDASCGSQRIIVLGQNTPPIAQIIEPVQGDSFLEGAIVVGQFTCIENEILFTNENGLFTAIVESNIVESYVGCELTINANDQFDNSAEQTFFLPINFDNPEFNLVLEKPELVENNLFGYGQIVGFRVGIESSRIKGLRNIRVELKPSWLNSPVLLSIDKNSQYFTVALEMPDKESNLQEIEVGVEASAMVGGKRVFDLEKLELLLTDKINLEFKYPSSEATVLDPEYANTLVVALTYPNGDSIENGEVEAVLGVDDRQEPILLTKNVQTGLFEAPLSEEFKLGNYVLTLQLADEAGGDEESVVVNIFQPFDFVMIAMLIIGLFFVFSLVYFVRKILKEKAEKLEELKTKMQNLKGMTKRLRYEYFKRHITEDEFKERLLETQQELATVEKKIEKKEVEPKKNPKGFSGKELQEIDHIVKRLKPKVAKFSKEETYAALLQEKCSPKLAKEVIKQLYDKKT
ncbi:MAG: hypothetical protein CL943_03675 [Candidatus Diapherotrites archaeon]|uniref:Uncharacterized protein n=1 Tax=Candidatus Iainarchaeum sp. TaxID=3101447 RepID=A0A2D6M1R1_9ARCH|nr:hypothetical protein [Candidatus Diapherotrites archaeon]